MEGIITASSQIAPSGKEGRTFSIQTIQFGRRGDFCQTFKSFSFELNSDDCRKEGRRFKQETFEIASFQFQICKVKFTKY